MDGEREAKERPFLRHFAWNHEPADYLDPEFLDVQDHIRHELERVIRGHVQKTPIED